MLFEALFLAQHGHAHGAPRALQQGLGVHIGLRRQAGKLFEAGAKHALHTDDRHTVGGTGIALAVKLGEIDTRPEVLLEIEHLGTGAAKVQNALDDHKPGGHRGGEQQGHHRLHHGAGVQHQIDQAELFVHSLSGVDARRAQFSKRALARRTHRQGGLSRALQAWPGSDVGNSPDRRRCDHFMPGHSIHMHLQTIAR